MSPIPSPTPLRRVFARLLFSPASLLFGFVVLIVVTCPGARGDEGAGSISSRDPVFGSSAAVLNLGFKATASAPAPRKAIGRSTRFDRAPAAATSGAPAAQRGSTARGAAGDSQTALPLFVDSLLGAGAARPAVDIRPMTGPPVGIRTSLPLGTF